MTDPTAPIASPEATTDAAPAWHTLTVAQVAEKLAADPLRGLDEDEVSRRRERFGANRLAESQGRSAWSILLAQFRSLVVGLLVAAALIALAMNEWLEAGAIVIVIALNSLIGFATEWRADQALAALRRQVVPEAEVIRGGRERQIPAAELVPGDVVLLAAGQRVPADGRVLEALRLQIDEAALTGESHAVSKQVAPVGDAGTPLGDRLDVAYMGTVVTDGRGRLLVTATGHRTEMGRIGTLIEEAGKQETPLEIKLEQLGRTLVYLVLGLCAVIVVAGLLRGIAPLRMLEVGISLAIAAVPEGLPAVATMTLALGMQRMARMRALVRRLPAVETLGSTTVICTDKTGTLTRNEMTVTTYVLGSRRLEVGGVGYEPSGEFREDGRRIDPQSDALLSRALRIGALCNDARMERAEEGDAAIGDPTEAALIVAAEKAGIDLKRLRREFERVHEIPFESERMRMVTVHRTPEGRQVALVKGSPGAVLKLCNAKLADGRVEPLDEAGREEQLEFNRQLADQALRVLALAERQLPEAFDEADLERDLTYVGLVGMIDPLREEAREAIATCRGAGIRSIMITGDQVGTAAEIARQLGLDRDPKGRAMKTVHARELDGLDDEGWGRVAEDAAVFARVSPEHKLRIVEALQRRGEVVAMTGDGVNDAPALKKADIGVAMGIKGTEVAKETADMIVTDDNFASIVRAVEQGRIIYANIIKFIHYLFSCNFAEVITVFTAIVTGLPLPLLPLQILWLNMITDVFPALALALEPSAPGIMRRPPRDPDERLLRPRFLGLIAWQGLMIAVLTLLVFLVGLRWYGSEGAGPGPRADDGVHDAGAVAGLARIQYPVAGADDLRRSVVPQPVALGGGRGLLPAPVSGSLRAAAAASSADGTAEPGGFRAGQSLCVGADSDCRAGEMGTTDGGCWTGGGSGSKRGRSMTDGRWSLTKWPVGKRRSGCDMADSSHPRPETTCARPAAEPAMVTGPLVPPLQLSVVYRVDGLEQIDALYEGREPGFLYARDGHPNGVELASKVAALEGAEAALVFASGMAAEAAVFLTLLESGEQVALSEGVYGRTGRLVRELGRFGIEHALFDATRPETLRAALTPRTRVVFAETLSNPLVRLADIGGLAEVAREAGALLAIDHTFAPLLCQPIGLGADLVTHSGTKLIGGHSDLTLGLLAGSSELIGRAGAVGSTFGLTGNPFECWLALRGIATLAVRSRQACASAIVLAAKLEAHPKVRAVHYPGLASHPDHERAGTSLQGGFGTIATLDLGGRAEADTLIQELRDSIPFAPSLGDVATTLSHPATTSHRGQSAEQWARQGITAGMVRLSVGLEDPEDLWAEIEGALGRL